MNRDNFGRLPAKYSFALNPYADERFSRCPGCKGLMNPRKFALLIAVEGSDLTILGKTCRYCPRCEMIIAHQDELESILAQSFSTRAPEVIGNQYLVLGTVELRAWRRGLKRSLPLEQLQSQTAGFKKYLSLKVEKGGWRPTK